MSEKVTPWWKALRLRAEITGATGSIDDVQMSLFNAVYGIAGQKPLYGDPVYYGEITHPSQNLTEILARVAVRLSAPSARYTAAPALYRLSQGMGGGKSHGLIGLWHLAQHPHQFLTTDIGKHVFAEATRIAGSALPGDLREPQTVVLACDNMTVGYGNSHIDGPAISLYERFLWRLFGGDNTLYKRYQPDYADKNRIAEALAAVGRPVLILVDEIMDYIRQFSDSANADLAVRDMAFLKALLDTVNSVPNVAMVVVMIGSEKDSMVLDEAGQARRAELADQLDRNGRPATVTSNTDFAAILRRRLFDMPAPAEVISATSTLFQQSITSVWARNVFSGTLATIDFSEEVSRCYPFHPSLISLAEQEWAPISGFQKVRSTIRIFAASAYVLAERANVGDWTPYLIGIGDLPLSSSIVREALIGSGLIADEKTQANYRQLAATDIVGDDDRSGNARTLDINRGGTLYDSNPRAAERVATALFLYSIVGARSQGRQGATENELKAASFVPDATYGMADADTILSELDNPETGLAALERLPGVGGQPARLYLTTRQTLNMLFRANRAYVTEADRDEEFTAVAERLAKPHPFQEVKFVADNSSSERPCSPRDLLAASDIDAARRTRLVVLDPRSFSLLNGIDKDTRHAIRAAFGLGPDKMAVGWASSVVFAVVNTQRRGTARAAVSKYIAWKRVCQRENVRQDKDLFLEAQTNLRNAEKDMEKAIKWAYQHIVYLDEQTTPDGSKERVEREIRIEKDDESALSGSVVWDKLVEREKAFGLGDFDAKALLANLNDSDYGRPLDEVRDLFWNSPRMPLLYGGEADLQNAIFSAAQKGQMRLMSSDGTERAITQPGEIPVRLSSLRLAQPQPVQVPEVLQLMHESGISGQGKPIGNSIITDHAALHPSYTATSNTEVQLSFSLNTSLNGSKRPDIWRLISHIATIIDEEQATHLQLSIKIVVTEAEAATVTQLTQPLGVQTTKVDM